MEPVTAALLAAIHPRHPGGEVDTERWEHADWQELVTLADSHRLGGLLHRRRSRLPGLPPRVANHFEEAYLRQTARAMVAGETLEAALEALTGAGVTGLLLKGAALLDGVYGDLGTRDIGDLDILVAEGALKTAARALTAAGFLPTTPREAGEHPSPPAWHRLHPVCRLDGLVPVEIHRHIVKTAGQAATFDAEDLLRRGEQTPRSPGHLVPSPEDLLLHLCLHFSMGRLIRSCGALAQIRDIVRVISDTPVDWERFVASSGRYEVTGATFLALFVVRELGLPVPEAPYQELRPAAFDPDQGRLFVRRRVMGREPWLPVNAWSPSLTGAREAIWWARQHLSSRDGVAADAVPALLPRRRALTSLAGRMVQGPGDLLEDVRTSRWMERSL